MPEEKNNEKKKFSLKGFFFNDDATTPTEVKTEKPVASVQQPTAPVQSAPIGMGGTVVGVVNKDVYNTLMKVLEERNLPGPDYLELKKAADSMAAVITDETTRYFSAFSVLKSSNPTFNKSMVMDSLNEYIKFIESERSGAKVELQSIYDNEVGFRQKEIQKRVDIIENNKKKIEELNAEILTVSQEINTINGEMLAKQTELDIQEKNFNVTVDAVIAGLNTDKEKLNLIIKE